jgi:proteasome alpha subunit
MYSPYDFNQSIAHRAEYVEERLKNGSPVVGISYDNGVLLFTVKRTQRKVFEIYDQLMYSAIGAQADVEAVRLAAIDFAHQEGFSRSPDDVSIQRLVGFVLSPAIKRAFSDPMTSPNVLRAVFAEVGKTPERDSFFVLNYDGEFTNSSRFAFAGGSTPAEDAMRAELERHNDIPDLQSALSRALASWKAGSTSHVEDDDVDNEDGKKKHTAADEALESGEFEAAVLERNTPRESKFRLLSQDELSAVT